MAALSVVLGVGYVLTSVRARRLSRQRSDLLQEVGLLQTALLPAGARVGRRGAHVGGLPAVRRSRRGRRLLRRDDAAGRTRGVHPRRRVGPRPRRARPHRLHALHAARLPRGRPRPAHHAAGGRPGDRRAPGRRLRDRGAGGARSRATARSPTPAPGTRRRSWSAPAATSPCSRPRRRRSGWACAPGFARRRCRCRPGSVACLYTDGLAEARTERSILGRPRLGDIVEELGRNVTAQELLDRVAREARLVTDDMATVVLTPTRGRHRRRLSLRAARDRRGRGARRPPAPVPGRPAASRTADAAEPPRPRSHELARAHGGAVLHVEYGIRGPRVDVLPRNVESLEAASRRAALAIG